MCGSCASNWGYCGCTGGDVFGMCPCSKGLECPICGHYPNKAVSLSKLKLADIIKPSALKKEQAAYKKLEKTKSKKGASRKPVKAKKPKKAVKPRKTAKPKKK